MPSGHPLTKEQKEFIDRNSDNMLVSHMARELGLKRKTIRRYLNRKQGS